MSELRAWWHVMHALADATGPETPSGLAFRLGNALKADAVRAVISDLLSRSYVIETTYQPLRGAPQPAYALTDAGRAGMPRRPACGARRGR